MRTVNVRIVKSIYIDGKSLPGRGNLGGAN